MYQNISRANEQTKILTIFYTIYPCLCDLSHLISSLSCELYKCLDTGRDGMEMNPLLNTNVISLMMYYYLNMKRLAFQIRDNLDGLLFLIWKIEVLNPVDWSSNLYSCSPRRVSRKLWTVYETVSCMQQFRERYASRTCYYVRDSL